MTLKDGPITKTIPKNVTKKRNFTVNEIFSLSTIIENKRTYYGGGGSTPGDKSNNKAYPSSLGQVGEAKLNAFKGKRLARLKEQGFAKGDEKILKILCWGLVGYVGCVGPFKLENVLPGKAGG